MTRHPKNIDLERVHRRKSISDNLSVLTAYLVLGVVLTYPLIRFLNGRILGDGDAWKFAWNLWWFNTSLVQGGNPLHAVSLHYPHGEWAFLHTWNYLTALAAVPMQTVMSVTAAYNLLALASFVLAAFGMYRLGRQAGWGAWSAGIAGMAYSFGPYHFAHALGHGNLIHYQWIPFFIQSCLAGEAEGWPGKRVWRSAGWLVLVGLTDWYYFVFCLIGVAVLVLTGLRHGTLRDRAALATAARGGVLVPGAAIVALSPLLAGMIWQAGQGIPPQTSAAVFSADLESFVVPAAVSTYSRWFEPVYARWTGNPAEWGSFIPWSVAVLALVGLLRLERWQKIRWGAWIVLFGLFSLGPVLHIGGQTVEWFRLPYGWLEQVPGLSIMQAPARFHVMTYLGICLVYGAALEAARTRWRTIAVVGLGVLAATESLCLPVQTTPTEVSPFYHRLAEDRSERAVIDLSYGSRAMYYQTVHGHPILGSDGMLARQSERSLRYLRETPVIRELVSSQAIKALHFGMPDELPWAQLAAAAPRELVALARIRGPGRLSVVACRSLELWLDDRQIAADQLPGNRAGMVTTDSMGGATAVLPATTLTRETAVAGGKPALLRIRCQLISGDINRSEPPVKLFWNGIPLNGAALRNLDNALQLEPVARMVGQADRGLFWVFYPSAQACTPSVEELAVAQRLARLGFGWIIVPYYGNPRCVEQIVGTPPVYRDRWLDAWRLPPPGRE